ncbi:unnamed protein product, partial [Porites evermanni]
LTGGSVWCSQWISNHRIQSFPNDEGLVSLKYFLDKREVKDPPTDTLVRMAELVTLRTFQFNGEYYTQVGSVAMVVLLSFSGSTWFTDSGDAHLPHLPNMPQLFPSDGKVVEILDGSMERFRDKLVLNGVSAVLFYAPWCGQSLYAAHEFNTAAKMLHTEVVVFIAINCWVGTCLQEQNIDVFPKLVAIHTQFNGVEYKGSFKAAKMVSF